MGGRIAPRCAVVGAGYAGMAAAVTLAGHGLPVTVFESGPVPGGRARRVRSEGRELDNGQHILVGAYTELATLMRTVGVPGDAVLRLPLELRYVDGFSFRALWLPFPLGLLGGLLAARLPLSERIGAVRFVLALRRPAHRFQADLTVEELLRSHGQQGKIGHYLWRPLCVSALNTPPAHASASAFRAVLRDSLFSTEEASDLILPRVDLSKLFPEPAADFVRARGGEVRCGAPVRELAALRDEFDCVIVAVGPHQLKGLLAEAPQFEYQPIYTCYLQYPGSVRLPFPMLGLAGRLVQWVFDRGALLGEQGRLACVISAQGDHQQLAQDELAAACHSELAQGLRALPQPQWSRVIAEKRATVACTPGRPRPSLETTMEGVYLAGDYTDPEYPPTLEAAVRSGVRAARAVLGRAERTLA